MAAKQDDIMTMDELAEYLKISKSTLYKLAQDNKLPGQKIGKPWRYLLIPHDQIQDQMTLAGLAARYEVHAKS